MRLTNNQKLRIQKELLNELTNIDWESITKAEDDLAQEVINDVPGFSQIKESFKNRLDLLFIKSSRIYFTYTSSTRNFIRFSLVNSQVVPNCLNYTTNPYKIRSKKLISKIKDFRKHVDEQKEIYDKTKRALNKVVQQYKSDTALKKDFPEWSMAIDIALNKPVTITEEDRALLRLKQLNRRGK